MSFTQVSETPARLNRCELAVPGIRTELFAKAAKSAADVVFLDLEDAVAPDDKEQARQNVIRRINDIDWGRDRSRCASTASIRTACIAMSSTCSNRPATGSTSS